MVDEFFKKLVNKKRIKPIEKVTSLELALLVGLTSYTDESKEGWMSMKEILADRGNDGRLLFGSPTECFPKYIKGLVGKGIVEERKEPFHDARKRPHKRKIWRLNRENEVRDRVCDLILSSRSYRIDNFQVDRRGNVSGKQIFKSQLNLDVKKILGRNYFKTGDDRGMEAIDKKIQEYRDKIALLERIKRYRSIKNKGGK